MSFGVGVGDIFAVLALASKTRERFINSRDEFRAISDEVKNLSDVLRDLDDASPERDLTKIQEARLIKLISSCEDVLKDLNKVMDKYGILDKHPTTLFGKIEKQYKKLTWDPTDIEELRSRITSNISLLNAFNGNIIRKGVARSNRFESGEERRIITDWLSSIDFSNQQNDFINRHQEGTGQWLLNSEDFKNWVDEQGQTLFCHGIPGAGKTIITSIVIENLCNRFHDNDVGIAFIYCSYKNEQEQKFDKLMLSLLKQLVQQRHDLPLKIQRLYQGHITRGTRPSIKEVTEVLRSVMTCYSRVFIIVDALDESAKTDREQLLEELFRFQSQGQVNIFATSRSLPEIAIHFNINESLEIRASEEDVRRYLENHIWRFPRFVLQNADLQKDIISQIVDVVDGMFLLAQLHLNSLESKTTIRAIKAALQRLPRGSEALDATYKETVERIEAQPTDYRDLSKMVFSWITYAKRPLTTTELQHALAIEACDRIIDEENFSEVDTIISVCAGLVTIEKESNTVRFVHHTTQEYLEQNCSSWISNGQTDIATACLTYISSETFANDLSSVREEFEAMIKKNVFLGYAANHWGFHVKDALNDYLKSSSLSVLETESKIACLGQVLTSQPDNFHAQPSVSAIHLVVYFELNDLLPILLNKGYSPDSKDMSGQTPLHWAAKYGNQEAVEFLIEQQDVEVNQRDNFGCSSLIRAVINKQEKIVKLLLKRSDVDVNLMNIGNSTPLHCAASRGHEDCMRLLLERSDVEVNLMNKDNWTPLSLAISFGYEDCVRLLLERSDVEVNLMNENSSTPLSLAICCGYEDCDDADVNLMSKDQTPLSRAILDKHETIVKLLLKRSDIDVNLMNKDKVTSLNLAVFRGYEGYVRLLLERNDVDVNLMSRDLTPLSLAILIEHESIVKLLLKRSDIDVNLMNKDKVTSLNLAVFRGYEGYVRLLLERNDVDVNLMSRDLTPLSLAILIEHESIVKLLLKRSDIDVNLMNKDKVTSLNLAVFRGYEGYVRLLLERNDVDVNLMSRDLTPLSLAILIEHESIVKLLLKRSDIDVNLMSKDQTPLSRAILKEHEAIVKLLLKRSDIDVNLMNKDKLTPLHLAVLRGYEGCVRLLLERNDVDVNLMNAHDLTPLFLAILKEHESIVKLLLKRSDIDVNLARHDVTPLSLALISQNDSILKMVKDRIVVDVNSTTKEAD